MKLLLLIVILIVNMNLFAQINADSSDSVWAIVIPTAKAEDVNLGDCFVGHAKDSLIQNYIMNISNWDFLINEVKIFGIDSSSFSIISDSKNVSLAKYTNLNVEFRFNPIKAGIHNAEIMIVSPIDTLFYKIVGNGIEKKLEILTENIDFGEVEIGNDSSIFNFPLIKNISNDFVEINQFFFSGPDFEQFEILSPNSNFTLSAGETKEFSLRFKPKYIGRTGTQIAFNYKNSISPIFANLVGKAIGAFIYIENDSAFSGEKRNLFLKIANLSKGGFSNIANKFSAKIRFQKTILAVSSAYEWLIKNDSTIITINGNIDTSNTLAIFEVIAGLGVSEKTTVDIIEFVLFDKDNQAISEYDFETKSGIFKVLGVCDEGGKRLINPENESSLKIESNPEKKFINLHINIAEKGNSYIRIINSNGKLIEKFDFNGIYNDLLLNFDTSNYANGVYFVIFETPTIRINEQFIIIK